MRLLALNYGRAVAAHTTYADLLRPANRTHARLYDAALVVGGSIIVALSARLSILLPFSPVPVTGQTFAVLMIGALLGARRASLCMIVYLLEGAAGLPVFALGGGIAVLFGPTGGYLVGFVAAAYVTGKLAQWGWDRRVTSTILAMICGNAAIYTFGLSWLSLLVFVGRIPVETDGLLAAGLYPFLPCDLAKIVLAAILLPSGWKLIRYLAPHIAQEEQTG